MKEKRTDLGAASGAEVREYSIESIEIASAGGRCRTSEPDRLRGGRHACLHILDYKYIYIFPEI